MLRSAFSKVGQAVSTYLHGDEYTRTLSRLEDMEQRLGREAQHHPEYIRMVRQCEAMERREPGKGPAPRR